MPEFRMEKRFGFWPNSENVYIVTKTITWKDNSGRSEEGPTTYQTWFYDKSGKFDGWINGRRIADSKSGDAMLFVDNQNRVITLTKTYTVKRRLSSSSGPTAQSPNPNDCSLIFASGFSFATRVWS